MKLASDVPEEVYHQFQMNYLRLHQFKADTVSFRIERYEDLMDDILLFRKAILDIRQDAGDDGLSRDERSTIHLYQHRIERDLGMIERMRDISSLHDRLDHLNDTIERHAEMWGIDSW